MRTPKFSYPTWYRVSMPVQSYNSCTFFYYPQFPPPPQQGVSSGAPVSNSERSARWAALVFWATPRRGLAPEGIGQVIEHLDPSSKHGSEWHGLLVEQKRLSFGRMELAGGVRNSYFLVGPVLQHIGIGILKHTHIAEQVIQMVGTSCIRMVEQRASSRTLKTSALVWGPFQCFSALRIGRCSARCA